MAYNNSISPASRYIPILDGVYKAESKSAILDLSDERVQFVGANAVKVFKTSMDGLGAYDRNAGYPTGSVTGTWETLTLSQDRGKSFSIDAMDNDETLGLAFGTLVGEFQRTKVAPEADAYRFAKYATAAITANNYAYADITVGTTDVPELIATAQQVQGDAEVPAEGKILFISETAYAGLKAKIERRVINNETGIVVAVDYYDGMRVIKVPKGRFNTAVTIGANGFSVPSGTSYPINFMIIAPSAVQQIVKHLVPRVFSPEVNQSADAWKFDYRIVHDAFVLDNKVDGIYLHRAASANS